MRTHEEIMKLQTYKMFEGEDTVYIERDDVLKLLEQEPCETQMIDKSNFSQEQYKADLQSAYDCGKASVKPCEDAISREDALMALTGEWTELTDEMIHRFIKRIKKLSPVTPQPKTDMLDKIRAEIEKIEKNYGFDKATKYGNKNAKQQNLSYSTMMMYEVASIIDEIKEIIDKYRESEG